MSETTTSKVSGRSLYQRTIPVFLVSFLTAVLIAQYFINIGPLNDLATGLSNWGVIVSAFIMLFGNVLLLLGNVRTLARRRNTKEVFNSAVFLIVGALFVIIGATDPAKLTNGVLFLGIYAGTLGVINVTLWLNASAYEAWEVIKLASRIRSLDAIAFMFALLPSVFYRMTLMLYIWPPFFDIGYWFITVPNVAVTRAAVGTAAVGGVVLGIRALWGKEPGLVEMEMK